MNGLLESSEKPKMTNHTPQNQPHGNQSSTSRAEQPTPVSANSQSMGTGQNPGRDLATDAKNAVTNATSEAKQQVKEVTRAAQEQAGSFLGEQKDMAAERIEGVAQALRQAGQELAGRDEGTLAQYTDSLAGQLDKFSNSLRDREIGALLDDAKQLAYRQPELFVAGALAAGFVLGRFFKSSRAARYDRGGEYPYNYPDYRESYAQNYGGNYREGYGQNYGQGYGSYAYDEFDPRDASRSYGESYGQRYGDTFSSGQGSSEQGNAGQGSAGQSANWTGEANRNAYQPTTQGSSMGQSTERENELRKGQEFGQGEEQVSNYKGNETKPASEAAKKPGDRQEGELR
jgi:hypothetical protein